LRFGVWGLVAGSEITVGKVLIVPDLGARNPFNFLRLRVKISPDLQKKGLV